MGATVGVAMAMASAGAPPAGMGEREATQGSRAASAGRGPPEGVGRKAVWRAGVVEWREVVGVA